MSIWDGVATKEEKRILREIEGARLPDSRRVLRCHKCDEPCEVVGETAYTDIAVCPAHGKFSRQVRRASVMGMIAMTSNEDEVDRFHREMFERRISDLEALVKRIATHLGVEGG